MRRIEFIEPVKAMRGNLTGKVDLQYAQNNNPAFYAPEGKQFARNYGPSYIGNKRASDGHKYFSVKTKSATKIDAATLLQMATFGATGALIGSMYSHKSQTAFINASAVYTLQKQNNPEIGSFRAWLSDNVSYMFKNKIQRLTISETTAAGVTVTFNLDNVFATGTETTGAELSQAVIVKFWAQLALNGVKYKVQGAAEPLIGYETGYFTGIINNSKINTLGLSFHDETGGARAVVQDFGQGRYRYLNVRDAAGIVGHDYTATDEDQVGLQAGNSYYMGDTFLARE